MNIFKMTIDYDKLSRLIDIATLDNPTSKVRIAMSTKTLSRIKIGEMFWPSTHSEQVGGYVYNGVSIVTDESLEFGEVKMLLELYCAV